MSSFISNFFGETKKKPVRKKCLTDKTKQPVGSVKYGDYYFTGIKKSSKPDNKYDAIFQNVKTGKERRVSFGNKKEKDYTQHKDKSLKEFYEFKHRNDKIDNLMSATALNKYILWNKPSVDLGVRSYKRKLADSK